MNFDSFRVPPAPAGLREKVLTSAQSQTAVPAIQDWVDRIWENRLLRIAWATAVVCICAFYFLWQPPQEHVEIRRLDLEDRLVEKAKSDDSGLTRSSLTKAILEERRGS